MDPIFGNNKELLKEYKILVKEIIPSLNECQMCQNLKCKYCLKFSVVDVSRTNVLIVINSINQKTY